MSTSKERFAIPNFMNLKIRLHTVEGFIQIPNMFFGARRNTVRGLEEWIAHYNHETEHDYLTGDYLYELTTDDGGKLFVRFYEGGAVFGSSAVFNQ